MYFDSHRFEEFSDGYHYDCWYVGLAIGNTARQCNDWWSNKANKRARYIDLKTTGRCGLEGLMWAKQTLNTFMIGHKSLYTQQIVIDAADDQRKHVYSRLMKIEIGKAHNCGYGIYDNEEVIMLDF
jgi:hypothetical protein